MQVHDTSLIIIHLLGYLIGYFSDNDNVPVALKRSRLMLMEPVSRWISSSSTGLSNVKNKISQQAVLQIRYVYPGSGFFFHLGSRTNNNKKAEGKIQKIN
jgi:hypothetical protein